MMSSPCDCLDDYLGRWLSELQVQAFLAHLGVCSICRKAVDEHRRLEQLLTQAVARETTLPAGLTKRTQTRLRRARARRALLGIAALAAALLITMGVSIWIVTKPVVPDHSGFDSTARSEEPVPMAKGMTRVTPFSSGFTAVPIESRNAAVTIVWFFPDRSRTQGR